MKKSNLLGYEYVQSAAQAAYFVRSVPEAELGDYLIAYHGDVVIGVRQWHGEMIDIPVMAAGGIGSGKSMLAAFALGAEGVQIGSRFAVCKESSAHENFKQIILDSSDGATDLTLKEIAPVRMLKNEFYKNIRLLFEFLESCVQNRKIRSYGLASWNGFRRYPDSDYYLDIIRIVDAAVDVAGKDHHFQYLEIPTSIGMPFIFNSSIVINNIKKNFLEFISGDLELNVLSSASLYEGNLEKLFNLDRIMKYAGQCDSKNNSYSADVSFPVSENSLSQLFDLLQNTKMKKIDLENELINTDDEKIGIYPLALNIVRSIPYFTSALVGMTSKEFVIDNIKLAKKNKLKLDQVEKFMRNLST